MSSKAGLSAYTWLTLSFTSERLVCDLQDRRIASGRLDLDAKFNLSQTLPPAVMCAHRGYCGTKEKIGGLCCCRLSYMPGYKRWERSILPICSLVRMKLKRAGGRPSWVQSAMAVAAPGRVGGGGYQAPRMQGLLCWLVPAHDMQAYHLLCYRLQSRHCDQRSKPDTAYRCFDKVAAIQPETEHAAKLACEAFNHQGSIRMPHSTL